MNITSARNLGQRDGVDGVYWRKDGEFHGNFADTSYELTARARIVANMAPHLPKDEAIVHVGKHNVRILKHGSDFLIVFLQTDHPASKSIKRSMRRVMGLPRDW